MKKMLHKILSVLLAACFILSAVPAPAAAAELPANDTTNGSYTDGKWSEGGNGSVTHEIDGTKVTLSKTAAPVEGMENTFDITLKVETSTSTSVHTASGAVVLVIDLSNSMDYCAECRGESYHSFSCKHSGRVTAAQSRLVAAKAAAANFLSSYAGSDANANRQLSIVYFATNYKVVMNWANVAGGAGNNSYNAALSTIQNLSLPWGDSGGTNLEGGLKTALDQLPAVSDYGSKSVVLLTDGIPTYRIGGGSGSSGSKANNDAAANQATAIKNAGAKLYTVCFGVADQTTYSGGPTVGNFLSGNVATSGCAYNADSSAELYAAFAAISESITSGLSGSGWTATDPMADMISVVNPGSNFTSSDGKNYTWALSNATTSTSGNVTTYTYTHTYRVQLDVQGENFEEGKFFPTNEPTYLNVKGAQYPFPVPGVTGVLPRTDVTVTKVWNDADNQDGIRPTEVTVQLMKGEKPIGEPVVLNADNKWTYTWDGETYDLVAKAQGNVQVYTVAEMNVTGYTPSVTAAEDNSFVLTLTNTHEVDKDNVTVTKVWQDNSNQDGIRPSMVKVQLYANDVAYGDPVEITGIGDTWTYTFENLDVNKAGKPIVYTAKEVGEYAGYTVSAEGLTVTNTHAPELISVSGTKTWTDDNDRDGIRPEFITVYLMNGETEVAKQDVTPDENGNWTYTFENVPKYQAGSVGQVINYTVKEADVAGYKPAYNGMNIENTHAPELIDVTITKIWDDNSNQDGKRPESIKVQLMNGETVVKEATVTGTGDTWGYTFTDLYKYEDGDEIVYTVREVDVNEYYNASSEGLKITNTHEIMKTSVTVTKDWQDANNQDGKRPQSVTVKLLANGNDTGKELTLTASGNWTGTFSELDMYVNGQQIAYTVEEEAVANYELTGISGNAKDGYTITNAYTPETTTVSGSKIWEDADNQDGKRPESIIINLVLRNEVIDSKTVTAGEDGTWTYSFEGLAKYENGGQPVPYVIVEDTTNLPEGYTAAVDGYDVTNTYAPEETSVTVTKVWEDGENRDGLRPNDITVLVKNGDETVGELVLNSGNKWTDTLTGLDKYSNGQEIVYTVEEVTVEGYTSESTGDAKEGFTITNTHTPATIDISGKKTWDDKDNQDGVRPESITVSLLANGKVLATKTVTADDKWAWTFEDVFLNENGKMIIYTISEAPVDGYSADYPKETYDIVNSYTPDTINIKVSKAWDDADDQDGLRPEKVTIKLLADGKDTGKTLELTAEDKWEGTFAELDKNKAGKEIIYTIEEVPVEGYKEAVIEGDHRTGFTVKNIHEPATTVVSGSKTWDDANNQDGKRPESIKVNLLANGQVVDTVTVTAKEQWTWTFDNLPVYENGGHEIVYTIAEEPVEGYKATYEGYNITNSYSPETINIKVNKSWVDSNDADGIRPSKVTIYLYANGEKTGDKLELTAKDKWTGSFTDLPKYEDGKEIKYTIAEKDVKGYNAVIKGSAEKGFTVTNSHNYIPKTGDERTPILWISTMAFGVLAMAIAGSTFFRKKRNSR